MSKIFSTHCQSPNLAKASKVEGYRRLKTLRHDIADSEIRPSPNTDSTDSIAWIAFGLREVDGLPVAGLCPKAQAMSEQGEIQNVWTTTGGRPTSEALDRD